MPQGPRLNLTQLSTLRELVRRGTLGPLDDGAAEQRHHVEIEVPSRGDPVPHQPVQVFVDEAGRLVDELLAALDRGEPRSAPGRRRAPGVR